MTVDRIDAMCIKMFLDRRKINVVLALPGSGKTTVVKALRDLGARDEAPVACDLDLRGIAAHTSDLHLIPRTTWAMGELVNAMAQEDIFVFSFARYFNPQALRCRPRCLMVIPSDTPEERAAIIRARGDKEVFAQTVLNEFSSWIESWLDQVPMYEQYMDVTVVRAAPGEYLSDTLLRLAREG